MRRRARPVRQLRSGRILAKHARFTCRRNLVARAMAVVGIDLGTTNSLVAAWTADGPRLIANALGETLTPSAVSVDGDEVLVGRAAVERLITHPEASASAFKRFMGSERQTLLAGRPYRPEELSALVLAELKRAAEAELGEAIEDAVISVPAYFNDLQRKATLAAARIAGLPVERLINEPTAAALAYGLEAGGEAQFLVFDLGGGTFDVSILDTYDDVMEVRATAGDNTLGGNDFRDCLAQMILERHKLDGQALTPAERARLTRSAEEVKLALSRQHTADYALSLVGATLTGTVERGAFEERAQPLIRRLRAPLERAVADSQIRPESIGQVVMVGGATRMPMVRQLAARLFGRLPLTHLDPDRVVALGAAVQAGLKARHAALGDVVMTDVAPYTLGIRALAGDGEAQETIVVPIIERNTVVPTSRSKPFFTVADGQELLTVAVYQGEHLKPDNNVLLGALDVAVPAAKAGQQGVDVRFTYDINGILEVEATALGTGATVRRVFRNACDLSDDDIAAALNRIAHLKVPPAEQAENRALIARAERIYAETTGEARARLVGLIGAFRAAIAEARPAEAERARAAFRAALDVLDVRPFDTID
jgi:molecular chaperone HscC